MASGYLTLSDYPGNWAEFACSRCDRRGRLRKDRLILEYGTEKRLPDLKVELARCPRAGATALAP